MSAAFKKEPSRLVHVMLRLICIGVSISVLPSVFYADKNHYFKAGHGFGLHHLPYRDFIWEFPPFTVPVLGFIPISFGHQLIFDIFMVSSMVAFEVFAYRRIKAMTTAENRSAIAWYWLLVCVPLSSIAYFRLDWPAAFFGVLALQGILLNRTRNTVLGVLGGFGVKVWTVVAVVPLFALRRYKVLVASVASCTLLIVAWYAYSPDGLRAFVNYRKGSAFQIESVPGSLVALFGTHTSFFQYGAWMVTDKGWSWVQTVLPGLFCLFAAVAAIRLWITRTFDVAALFASLVMLLLLTSRLVSPQYLVWLSPFAALLLPRCQRQAILFAVASLLTLVEIGLYSAVVDGQWWASLLVVVRNVILIAVLVDWLRLIKPDAVRNQGQLATATAGTSDI